MSAELLMVEQRRGRDDAAHWIREGGRTVPGQDSNLRLDELRAGLVRHERVRAVAADAGDAALERTLGTMHEPRYLEALRRVNGQPTVMAGFAPPGLEPDIPVDAALVAAAHEGVRTAITAAQRLAAGARFTYAVCRPPGHHAGPDFLGGYCYLNNAAAAARTLAEARGAAGRDPRPRPPLPERHRGAGRGDGGRDPALAARRAGDQRRPGDGAAPGRGRTRRRLRPPRPDADTYLEQVAASVDALAAGAAALVVSLGYDTVAGDPHGSWDFDPEIFAAIGRLLAGSGRPVCVIQEGGYLLPALAECSHAFATGLLGEGPG